MNVIDKLLFCKEHGISLTYIANQVNLAPATITKWIRGEKGITNKNEKNIELALQKLAKEIWENIGDYYGGDL